MITLVQFLEANGIALDRGAYKVHLAVPGGGDSPLNSFFEGRFDDYQGVQTKRNFQCKHVISLISLGNHRWLFVGVYQVHSVEPYKENFFWYEMSLLEGQEDLIGRVVVHYHRTGRASYRIGSTIEDECILHELLPQRMSIQTYPGHNHVRLSFRELSIIINQQEASWYGALSTVKGIYCIADQLTGKLYIGKADGQDGIWQRWSNYAYSGHGGNKDLKRLLQEKGIEHRQHFQFSLIEIADFQTPDDQIDARESHWKNVLLTREFGYNKN